MRRQVVLVALVMLLCAAGSSSAVITGAFAQPRPLTAMQQAKREGPKPTPRWYWRWQAWRLGEGRARDHRLQRAFRPRRTPRHISRWAWRRLHLVLLARAQRAGNGSTSLPNTNGSRSYEQAIAYSLRRPAFTPRRVVEVASASEFLSAVSNLRAGDLVRATARFTVSGETVISKRLSSWAVLDLGSNVSFDYGGGLNLPAVWLKNPSYLRIYGGNLTTEGTGGSCILSQGMQHVLWWGFVCHDAGGTGVDMFPVLAEISHSDFQGEVYRAGENRAWDPHAEKGSGIHGVNLDDSGQHAFSDNRFAFSIHDQPSGAGIEYGSTNIPPVRNTIYEKAVNLTFVSHTQTGGNAIQFWGVGGQSADVKYLEVSNVQGYGLFNGGMYGGTTLSGVTVEYGRASKTNQNPRYAGQNPWQTNKSVHYQDVTPSP